MPTVVIRHDLPIAAALEGRRSDLTVIAAESTDSAVSAVSNDGADILVVNPSLWDDRIAAGLNEGDWVQATSAGYAAFPLEEFQDRGVTFTNAAGNYGPPVSEHVFALAIAHARRLPVFFDAQSNHEWARDASHDATDWGGRELTVYGLGDIGEQIARRGLAFEMSVVGVKRDPTTYDGCLDPAAVIRPEDLLERLEETDLLAVSVPLTPETGHSIGASAFQRLPDSAVVINVARGPVVEEAALVDAIINGEIAGAGLDVFEEEPLPDDSPLWDLDEVIVTPHVGGRSDRFIPRFVALFLDNYDRRTDGESLVNRIV
ncbi:MAG: D-2-hydroxyacid dehydrogenase [Halobacteriales archaeon]|nr:D-2-hydroxyacid dehydrogenase [Halobacteriales archaeon]